MCNTVLESSYMLAEKLALAERFMKLAMFGYLAIMFFKCVCVCVCVCVCRLCVCVGCVCV